MSPSISILRQAGGIGAVPSRTGWFVPQLSAGRDHDLHRPAERHGLGGRINSPR